MKHSKEIKRLERILQQTTKDIFKLDLRRLKLIDKILKLRYEK